MKSLAIQDLIIAQAIKSETLAIKACNGRFGAFWSIEDQCGLIEVHVTEKEARDRVADIRERVS